MGRNGATFVPPFLSHLARGGVEQWAKRRDEDQRAIRLSGEREIDDVCIASKPHSTPHHHHHHPPLKKANKRAPMKRKMPVIPFAARACFASQPVLHMFGPLSGVIKTCWLPKPARQPASTRLPVSRMTKRISRPQREESGGRSSRRGKKMSLTRSQGRPQLQKG